MNEADEAGMGKTRRPVKTKSRSRSPAALSASPAHSRTCTANCALILSELIPELIAGLATGTLLEVFCVRTAVVVIPAARIGW